MTERLKIICSHLPAGKVLADVGCDHGYCAQFALRKKLFERVYVSDISAGSLKKAEKLLAKYVEAGSCVPVVADGMHGLSEKCDCVLIAGLGGEEIVRILSEGYVPENFVLQPMKNAEKVRAFLLERGCKITADYTFGEGLYYDLITGKNAGGDEYTEWEIKFGRDNLKAPSPSFIHRSEEERGKLKAYLERPNMQKESREEILTRLYELEVITNAFEEDI